MIPNSFRSFIRNGLRFAAISAISAPAVLIAGAAAEPVHGIAMHGDPALPADFTNLPYAVPDAPQGGRIAYGFVGTFDSLNPFILKGNAPRGLHDSTLGNNVFESLMMRSRAEPFTLYGLIAKTVDMPDDRGWIEFHLNAAARFSDGAPITADEPVSDASALGGMAIRPCRRISPICPMPIPMPPQCDPVESDPMLRFTANRRSETEGLV